MVQGEIRRVANKPYVLELSSSFTSTNPHLQSDFCYGFSHAVRFSDSHISVTEFRLSMFSVRIFWRFLFTVIMRAHEGIFQPRRIISITFWTISRASWRSTYEERNHVRKKIGRKIAWEEDSFSLFHKVFKNVLSYFLVVKDWNWMTEKTKFHKLESRRSFVIGASVNWLSRINEILLLRKVLIWVEFITG